MHRLAIATLLVAVACSSTASGGPSCPTPSGTAAFGRDARLDVDIADTDAAREHGLMGVTELPADQGMAFVWDAPIDATFWMKDTLIPLSIAFVDQRGQVVKVREMTPCEADPCPTYGAPIPYTTAIEANAGWFDEHGVRAGDEMKLERNMCL